MIIDFERWATVVVYGWGRLRVYLRAIFESDFGNLFGNRYLGARVSVIESVRFIRRSSAANKEQFLPKLKKSPEKRTAHY